MSTKQASKKNWGVAAIVTALIIITGLIIFGPTNSKNFSNPSAQNQYSNELKRITDKYSRCLENAELAPSKQTDPMEGTSLSRENTARGAREDCQRQYNIQKRVIENKY